jgi:hypothetical protein
MVEIYTVKPMMTTHANHMKTDDALMMQTEKHLIEHERNPWNKC